MFIGSIPAGVREYFGAISPAFAGQTFVVGCSGNFTCESILTRYAPGAVIHANDVSLYSTMVGHWLLGEPVDYTITDEDYAFARAFQADGLNRVATLLLLSAMSAYHRRRHAHEQRLWQGYRAAFPDLQAATVEKLQKVQVTLASYYAGDVLEHFQRFDGQDAIFCCFAPTYVGGYERQYRCLEQIVHWQPPSYPLLTAARRQELLAWISQRRHCWFADAPIPGREPALIYVHGRQRTVYLYANITPSALYVVDKPMAKLPNWRLADSATVLTPDTRIRLVPVKTSAMMAYKAVYLSKRVDPCAGMWAYAVLADDQVVGFLEFAREKFNQPGVLYLHADFAVAGTRYRRLSKLVLMLAVSGETQALLQQRTITRYTRLQTTAFTPHAVSMKYRGVMTVVKRSHTPTGAPFLNLTSPFTPLTWQETFCQWLQKHSTPSSPN